MLAVVMNLLRCLCTSCSVFYVIEKHAKKDFWHDLAISLAKNKIQRNNPARAVKPKPSVVSDVLRCSFLVNERT